MRTIGRVLRRLRIENLVLIREAELPFAPGLNAITGETGAGKTILAQAIGLLLGGRGDAGLVGPGASDAYVEAEFDLPPGLLDEEGLEELADLRPGGEEGLRAERERLRHLTDLVEAAATATQAVDPEDGDGAASLTAAAERAVAGVERLAPELARAGDELRDVELRLRETASALRGF